MSDFFTEQERDEIGYARAHVRGAAFLRIPANNAITIIAKQAQLIEQMQEQLDRLQALTTTESPESLAFLGQLFEQADEVARPIKATGAKCHFDMSSHVMNGEVVIVLTPVAKEDKVPRGIGATL